MTDREVEPVEVVVSHSPRRVTQIGVRRKYDVNLFKGLSPEMEKAAQAIRDGFMGITEGLHVKTWIVERIDSGPSTARDYITDCITWWWRWGHEMQRERLQTYPVIDVFALGKSCREVDRERRKRNGWTKIQIDEGLKLYCRVRGWN